MRDALGWGSEVDNREIQVKGRKYCKCEEMILI